MEGDGDCVQVSVESSWSVVQGSLDSCVAVVFLDPHTQEPIFSSSPLASEKLVLVPPTEPVPCEITVKFQGRLCHVQSFYTLSTARTFEIYSQSKPETDRDYICTVKGWIPHEDKFSSDEGSEVDLEAVDGMGRNEMQLNSRKETDFIQENISKDVMSNVGSPTIALNSSVDVDSQKSVSSSGEDGWVDVRLNRSFSAENAPELENWHLPLNVDELANLEDQLVLRTNAEDIGVEDDSKLDGCGEEKVQFMEHMVQCNAQLDMFEAELELVDHSPWAAITIRLLSLQDKSLVEVNQMVFLAVSGPVPEPASPIQSAERGANSALFAMFLPSMLQMARGVSGNSKGPQKTENLIQSCEEAQNIVETDKLPAGREEIGVASLQNSIVEGVSVQQGLLAYVHNVDACAASSKADGSLKLEEVDQTDLQQMDGNGEGSKSILESCDVPLQSGSSVMPGCNCGNSADNFMAKDLTKTLEAFSERFDRLETLCLRIESYLHRSFESLDQRITHLEVQHGNSSGERDCVHASSQQLGMPIEAPVVQSHHNKQEAPPSSMQYPSVSDLLPGYESKEEVPVSVAQSAEQQYSETHSVLEEASNAPLIESLKATEGDVAAALCDLWCSNCTAAENLVKEVPSESQEFSSGPATVVGGVAIHNKKPFASVDDAWASALSAFASSFTPVFVEAENTVTYQVDEQSLGSCDASVSKSQDFETLKEERNAVKEDFHSDVGSVAHVTNDEALNSDHGPAYEDFEQVHFDEQMPVAHVFSRNISLENQDILLPSHSLDLSASAPNGRFHLLGLQELQGISKKETAAQVETNHPADDTDFASKATFPIVSQDTQLACPQFDAFSSAHSSSMLFEETEDNLAAFRRFKTGLSPVFDYSSAEMHDSTFLSVNNKETEVHPHVNDTECSTFSVYQERGDSCYLGAKKQESLFYFSDEEPDYYSSGVSCRPVSSIFGEYNTSQFGEDEECNIRTYATVDFLSHFISSEQVEGSDINKVQDPESFNSASFTYCETEEARSFPDLLEEGCLNYLDGRTCSEHSLCFSQDFDACQNDLCDEWSCAPNIFYLHDPELTDDETEGAAVELDEKIERNNSMLEGDSSDTDSAQDVLIWHALHNARGDQQQPTTVFPGFENLS